MSEMIDRIARILQARDECFSPDEALDQVFINDARAVIEAMREPTREMLVMVTQMQSVFESYQAMIDGALSAKRTATPA